MSARSETPIDSAQELDELTRLRVELSYADWKAHPRFKKERVLREAQRKWGVPAVEALVEAVREVGNGGVYLPPAIARNVAFARPGFAQNPLSKLTSREMEILRLLSSGKSLSEIAWLVHSSYKTVANTSSIMRQKLGVRTSAELVRLEIESGVG